MKQLVPCLSHPIMNLWEKRILKKPKYDIVSTTPQLSEVTHACQRTHIQVPDSDTRVCVYRRFLSLPLPKRSLQHLQSIIERTWSHAKLNTMSIIKCRHKEDLPTFFYSVRLSCGCSLFSSKLSCPCYIFHFLHSKSRGCIPGGLTFLSKDAQCPIPAGKVFYPKSTNPLLIPWVSRGCPGGRPRGKLMISALVTYKPNWSSDRFWPNAEADFLQWTKFAY